MDDDLGRMDKSGFLIHASSPSNVFPEAGLCLTVTKSYPQAIRLLVPLRGSGCQEPAVRQFHILSIVSKEGCVTA